jgi:hypothetical protein
MRHALVALALAGAAVRRRGPDRSRSSSDTGRARAPTTAAGSAPWPPDQWPSR